jgi:hypothetical protein
VLPFLRACSGKQGKAHWRLSRAHDHRDGSGGLTNFKAATLTSDQRSVRLREWKDKKWFVQDKAGCQ